MALDAVLFDIDGTLLDSNGLHVNAWRKTLQHFGYTLGDDRIGLEIGKGGKMLVPSLLGEEVEQRYGDAMRTTHDELFGEIVNSGPVGIFPQVQELIHAIHERGLKVAVATASKKQHLDLMLEQAGLDLSSLVDVIITDTDVERSKPHPDVVTAAVEKSGMAPGQCVFVGDTPYDVQASMKAGVVCLGVLTGFWDSTALLRTGARAVYQSTEDLLDRLDEGIKAASPGSAHLTHDLMETLMQEALTEARTAAESGEMPVGAILAKGDGSVITHAQSRVVRDANLLAHAELLAMMDLHHNISNQARDLILVTNLEPCRMCYGAAFESHVDTIIYAVEVNRDGVVASNFSRRETDAVVPRMIGGVCEDESRLLLDRAGS